MPALPAATIALAVHQAVWARLFPGRGGSVAFRSSEEGKQTSQLQEMLGLAAALSSRYLSLAVNVCAGSPCHQPAAQRLLTLKPSLVVSRDGGSLPVFILVLHSLCFILECPACTGLL